MKIGQNIINGWFEYNPSYTYTQGDVVIRDIVINGSNVRKLYLVKTDVSGIQPELDLNLNYYEDYFNSVYGGSNLLTKSNILDFLGTLFAGLDESGNFSTTQIRLESLTSVNKSGVYSIADTNEVAYVIITESNCIMLITGDDLLAVRFGIRSGSNISWDQLIDISTNMDSYMTKVINRCTALEILLRRRALELTDISQILNS